CARGGGSLGNGLGTAGPRRIPGPGGTRSNHRPASSFPAADPCPRRPVSSRVRGAAWLVALLAAFAVGMAVVAVLEWRDNPARSWSLLPGVVAVLVAGVVFMTGRVSADDAGIRVYAGGLVKMLHVRPGAIGAAEARDITPGEFGGWGLRISGAGVAFILGAGPGAIVNRTRGGARIYSVATMDDADAMAGLLNSLAARQHPGRS
ncbi:MAG: hypothetical protein Q4P23_10040, partial [Micrococcaceae bacterium]|nr:hypothetical protein [Micrococcaceae bacterium]